MNLFFYICVVLYCRLYAPKTVLKLLLHITTGVFIQQTQSLFPDFQWETSDRAVLAFHYMFFAISSSDFGSLSSISDTSMLSEAGHILSTDVIISSTPKLYFTSVII